MKEENENDKKISAYLPSTAEVANKSGEYFGIENDCGIIYTGQGAYLFCVLTGEGNPNEQIGAISNLSKYIFDRYSQ